MVFELKIENDINWLSESIYLLNEGYRQRGSFRKEDFNLVEDENLFRLRPGQVYEDFADIVEFQTNILSDANDLYKEGSVWEVLSQPIQPGAGMESWLVYMSMNSKYNQVADLTKEDFALMNFRVFYRIFYKEGSGDDFLDGLLENKYKNSYFNEDSYDYNLRDIYDLVEKTQLSNEYKYGILKFFADLDELYFDFIDLLKDSEKILKRHLHIIKDRIEAKGKELSTKEGLEKLENSLKINEIFSNMSQEKLDRINFTGHYHAYIGLVLYKWGIIRTPTEKLYDPYIIVGIILTDLVDLSNKGSNFKESIIKMTNALGDKTRFEILGYLRQRPYYLKELAEIFDTSSASISHHLSILSESGLVRSYYDDRKVYYILNRDSLEGLGQSFISMAKEE